MGGKDMRHSVFEAFVLTSRVFFASLFVFAALIWCLGLLASYLLAIILLVACVYLLNILPYAGTFLLAG
jgi:hypothetical protein